MDRLARLFVTVLIPLFALNVMGDIGQVHGQDADTPCHTHIQTLTGDELKGLVSLVGSEDGKFLYGAALSSRLLTFCRDPESGEVEVIDSIGNLNGAVCLAISQDQKWVVVVGCHGKMVTLYSRDAADGTLCEVSRQQQGVDGVTGLDFPIAVTISPDSRFVYVTNSGGTGSLTAFSIKDDELKFLQKHDGVDGCMDGARLLTVDPDGEFLFVACRIANCLAVFDRDTDTGRLRFLNHVRDGNDNCNLLAGVHGVACSKDGRHLYATSGRFGGDSGITVFEILQREVLEKVEEVESGDGLNDFKGGNFIRISPDGKFVYATGAKSGNVVCLKRDGETGRLKNMFDLEVDGETDLGMTADVFVSSDNRFVYVVGEGQNQLFVFERQLEDVPEAEEVEKK